MTDLVEKVAKIMDVPPECAKAAIAVVLKETKLECVKQSHGPCVCGFVDKIARKNGIEI